MVDASVPKLDLQGIIFAGKGGVGKSNSAGSFAAYKAQRDRIAIFDHDGGHSISRVLFGTDEQYPVNKFLQTDISNIFLSVLEPLNFMNVTDWKERPRNDLLRNIDHYFGQFEDDQGYVCWNDMIMNFFGPACDISSISKFCYLTAKLYQAHEQGVKEIIVDVEPTEGLKNLLNCGVAAARSLRNLERIGIGELMLLGLKWKEISQFIAGDYMSRGDYYATRIEGAVDFMKKARYHVVTTPERSPVSQSFDVKKIIEGYGAKVYGYVINNLRGESYEPAQIARVQRKMSSLPVILVNHDIRLCDGEHAERKTALMEVGQQLSVFDVKKN